MDGWIGLSFLSVRTVYDVSPLRLVGVRVQEIELVLRVHDIVPHAAADGDDDDAVVDGDHDAAGADDDGDADDIASGEGDVASGDDDDSADGDDDGDDTATGSVDDAAGGDGDDAGDVDDDDTSSDDAGSNDDHDTAGGDGYDEMVLMMMMQVAMDAVLMMIMAYQGCCILYGYNCHLYMMLSLSILKVGRATRTE